MNLISSEVSDSGQPIPKIDDYRDLARARLPSEVFDYIDSGACDELTYAENILDFEKIKLLPLCMRNVSNLELSVDLLGQQYELPIGFSPTAFHRLVCDQGEVASANAARTLNVPMIVSCMSSISITDIAKYSNNEKLWLQLYIFRDRGVTAELVKCAERAGCKGIVVTTGVPVPGKRDRNIVNRFSLPEHVTAANFQMGTSIDHNNPLHSFAGAEIDSASTWKDIEWLRELTDLPVLLKGILNPRDVEPALAMDVRGIIVSNHGGRQLDTSVSTIRILPEISALVSGRIPLLIDSGIRRGTDVLKAIALGADGVLLGRPIVWALAVGGEQGVHRAVSDLADEFRTAMKIVGCPSLIDIRANADSILRLHF